MTTRRKQQKKKWREVIRIHPAADVFPTLSAAELKELAEDIDKHGLQSGVVLYIDPSTGEEYLLDGRNRLDAIDLLGRSVIDERGKIDKNYHHGNTLLDGYDPVAYVISANIKRRHLTKKQQADLIVAAVKAGKKDRAKSARSFSPAKGKKGGSSRSR